MYEVGDAKEKKLTIIADLLLLAQARIRNVCLLPSKPITKSAVAQGQ